MEKAYGNLLLEVPYSEKEEAKALGAWWDPEIRKWYVPSGKDINPFRKWIPGDGDEEEAEMQ